MHRQYLLPQRSVTEVNVVDRVLCGGLQTVHAAAGGDVRRERARAVHRGLAVHGGQGALAVQLLRALRRQAVLRRCGAVRQRLRH